MATANETLISVKGLKKHFGKLQVLKGQVDIDTTAEKCCGHRPSCIDCP